ncbi:ABC transporter ATP-binding protein [Candidatus Uabimicrobium amorphum]|uniref:ABC transporter ATP-binding protein n=1 Tax=Uabimicrobium amorphum TaxID=2596890 RepID=A0A5S9ITW7_UABAM|nr:ABC transporter ATP-binding protein [Candidatus Uabimicrobium amorphum]BBM87687.1 ABC transporter ATP-binding protein [Candidatus Uabimicrobium amorphum]
MIVIRDLSFSYGNDFAIELTHLEIASGQKVAFVGESGCGKTTLLSLIAGVLRPHKGEINVCEHKTHLLSEKELRLFRLQNIGFVFQNFALLDYLNVRENILLPFTLQSKKITQQTLDRLEYLLSAVGIRDKNKQKPQHLSQGEKQRVAIARALIHKPSIVIADEPTGNLDPKNSQKIMNLLWQEIDNTTFLMITHDHSVLDKFDRTVRFDAKGIVA